MKKVKDLSTRWHQLAKDDLKMAQLALRNGVYLQAMFHTQQCVEKALKGMIVRKFQKDPPYTHDLIRLLIELEGLHHFDAVIQKKISELNPYYILTCYPSYKIEISKGLTKDKIKKMISLSKEILSWLDQK